MLVGSRVAGAANNVGEEMAEEEGRGYGRRGLQLRLQILEQGRRQRRPKERAEVLSTERTEQQRLQEGQHQQAGVEAVVCCRWGREGCSLELMRQWWCTKKTASCIRISRQRSEKADDASSSVMELRLESEDTAMREERHGEVANANPDCGLTVAVELESLEEWCGEGKEEAENDGSSMM
ncbi:hypothetical protein GW17_00049983 [Ensete ventricosum]|nr:hypothetical protein GW17_00049983 [Ensete ventricosum]